MRKLFGYSDQISVRPGDTIRFMVSCLDNTSYRADIVRLICGDDSPEGPGFKETVIETPANGDYPGRAQAMHDGSCVVIPDNPLLDGISSFTLQAMIWPTTPLKGRQVLLGKWCEKTQTGFCLIIDENGATNLCLGDGSGAVENLGVGTAMIGREWYFVAASFDADSKEIRIFQEPLADSPGVGEAVSALARIKLAGPGANSARFIMAAQRQDSDGSAMNAFFNGKIDSPRLLNRALPRAEMAMLAGGPIAETLASDVLGWWDFSRDIPSTRISDLSANRLHGETVNLPTRGMRGFNWSGSENCWRHAPHEYSAIHFHDDDLYDAGWQADFELVIPEKMKSGVYCARLIGAGDEERIPFFVRPPAGESTSDVALLISTATFMAYANFRTDINMPLAEVNGELGGLWRRLGAPPNTLVGAGTIATGFDSASYYRRTPDSHDARAAFIFEGIENDELIGDFGSLLGGAAGVELDGANRKLGTPPHALVVARSEGHSQLYFLCPEETPYHHPVMSGAENERVRADLLFYETASGGGVFTTGSISWCASLAHEGYDNNVARITGNVLKRFLDPEPLYIPRPTRRCSKHNGGGNPLNYGSVLDECIAPHLLYRRLGKTTVERHAAYRAFFKTRSTESNPSIFSFWGKPESGPF